MPISFEEDWPEPDPHTSLVEYLSGWIETVRASRTQSPHTVRAYTSDLSQLAQELCGQLGKEPVYQRFAEPSPVTVAELARWPELTEAPLLTLKARLAGLELLDLHPANLSTVMRWAAAEKSASTVRRYRAALASFGRYLVAQHILVANPADDPAIVVPTQPSADIEPFTIDETERIVAATASVDPVQREPWPALDRAIVVLGLTTGLRADEMVTIPLNRLDLRGAEPFARVRGKGSKTRRIPLAPECIQAIDIYLAERADRFGPPPMTSLMLVSPKGAAIAQRALRTRLDRVLVRAGVVRREQASIHALRHTFATGLLDSGATIEEVRELLGHASVATTSRYLKAVAGGTREAIKAQQVRDVIRAAPSPALLGSPVSIPSGSAIRVE